MSDLRLALRRLLAHPGFTAVAVLTLALGIGANTAVYTVVHGVLLAPLPYTRPSEVVVLNEVSPQFAAPISVSWQNYQDWRDRSTAFETMAAVRTAQTTLTGVGEPERVTIRMATWTLLPALGVQLPLGRPFAEADDRAGAPAVAILSHQLWSRTFGRAADVVGRRLVLDAQPYEVIGVLPAEFELFQPADVYVPMEPWAATLPDDRGWHPGILPVARLARGVTLEQARAEMERITRQLEAEYPQFNRNVRARVARLQDVVVENVRPALLVLLAAVGLVLLIACANVANLLLARTATRQKEIAVRAALGGGRGRIVRQLVVESVVLASVGGVAGLLTAVWGVSALMAFLTGMPRSSQIEVDQPVLLFALGVTLGTGLLFGLAPALHATRVDLRAALNSDGRGAGPSPAHHRMRSALVVAEIALALVLLVSAGLMLRSFVALQRVEPGFVPANLLVVGLPLSPTTYGEDAARTAAVERLIERVTRVPDIASAAVTTALPMSGGGATIHFNIEGRAPRGPEDYRIAGYRAVSANYFETMGIPLRRGRTFTRADREGSRPVAVINESLARRHFEGLDPIGQRLAVGTEPAEGVPFYEIVGVVGDVLQSFEGGAGDEYYLPYAQYPYPVLGAMYRGVSLVARVAGEPLAVAPSLRAAIHESDPHQPLVNLRTMEQAIGQTVAQPRLQAVLLSLFASVAMLLALVGVYGVIAYSVAQRRQEIGVRVALGASRGAVVGMVVKQGMWLAAAGLVIGLALALAAAAALRAVLPAVQTVEPLTFAVSPVLLGIAALLASYLPARRAAATAPMVAIGR